jgi:hypothetical protein
MPVGVWLLHARQRCQGRCGGWPLLLLLLLAEQVLPLLCWCDSILAATHSCWWLIVDVRRGCCWS